MVWLLLLTLPFAAWVLYHFPDRAAEHDYKEILADGANDTLKEWFHFMQGAKRGMFMAWIVGIGAAPLLKLGWLPFVLLLLAQAVLAQAWFIYRFNPRLSELRGLPRYYVSADPRAAKFPDKFVWADAVRSVPMDGNREPAYTHRLRVEQAGVLLEDLLNKVLRRGAVVALALAGAAIWVAL